MGEVYRATDTELGRAVAVKVLAERHARDPDTRARFRREALAAAQLSGHRYVVTVFDVGEHAGRPFIVMELLEGGSVHDRLCRGRVNRALALRWLDETAEALDAAHAHGIVHRDVKPANLLLDQAESVRVSDFGIASAAGFDTITIPGTVLGTAGYMAPEQARGEPASAATDRYALGVVAFELLTGRRPFEADTPVTEALAHVHAEVPRASSVDPALPPALDAALVKALAKDPHDRHASSRELVADLRNAVEPPEAQTLVQAPAATQHYRRRGARVPAYAVAAAAILVVGIATAGLVAAIGGDGSGSRETRTQTNGSVGGTGTTEAPPAQPPPPQPPPPPTPQPPPASTTSLRELANAGYYRMVDGDFASALPLLEQAVAALSGSGSLDEAYASYNLAYTRYALGNCDGVLALLDRSEDVQGYRKPIDRLRKRAEKTCLGEHPGRGNDDRDD